MRSVLVMGYDARTEHLYKLIDKNESFNAEYYSPDCFDLYKLSQNSYDVVFLPVPTKTDEGLLLDYNVSIKQVMDAFNGAKFICAAVGRMDELKHADSFSLLEDADFVQKNAYLTAKAAIKIAEENADILLLPNMVVGNGRIGRYLVKMLEDMNAEIIIVSKSHKELSKSLKYYKCIGYKGISEYINDCGIIFNTAPYNYFTCEALNNYDGKYLELASKPYGFKQGRQLPQSVIMCPSLPGKHYPYEAARIIYDSIYDFVAKG